MGRPRLSGRARGASSAWAQDLSDAFSTDATDERLEAEKAAEEDLLESLQSASISSDHAATQLQLGNWLPEQQEFDLECGLGQPIVATPAVVEQWPSLTSQRSESTDGSTDVSRMVSAWLGGPSLAVYHTAHPAGRIGGRTADSELARASARVHPAPTIRKSDGPKRQERAHVPWSIRGVMEENNIDGDVLDARWHTAMRASCKSRGASRRIIGKHGRNLTRHRERQLQAPVVSARLASLAEEQASDARGPDLVARGMARMMLGGHMAGRAGSSESYRLHGNLM